MDVFAKDSRLVSFKLMLLHTNFSHLGLHLISILSYIEVHVLVCVYCTNYIVNSPQTNSPHIKLLQINMWTNGDLIWGELVLGRTTVKQCHRKYRHAYVNSFKQTWHVYKNR